MGSDLEMRIPLETFHQHFIVTHMKGKAAALLCELRQQADQAGQLLASQLSEWMRENYPQPAFRDDNWFSRIIPLDKCYFAHTDFRDFSVPKDQRFVDFLPEKRREIECGSFPCSLQIRAPWLGQMPEPLIQERGLERYYVLDGQCRVIRYWYHGVPNVSAFIYRGQLAV